MRVSPRPPPLRSAALTTALSSPLVSLPARRRFLDKTGYTGSTAQWLNGVVLLSTFFSVRIVYGWYLTVDFMRALYAARAELSTAYLIVFVLGNLTLNSLNAIWCVPALFSFLCACCVTEEY